MISLEVKYTAFVIVSYVDITNIIINIMKPTIENGVLRVCIWNCAAHYFFSVCRNTSLQNI
jgi:hypothetical protein